MIKDILSTLTAQGRRSLFASVVWFVLYALAGIGSALVMLGVIGAAGNGASLTPYWGALAFLLLLRGVAGALGDVRKHRAGFDLNYQLRERIMRRLKALSLGFYTTERLGHVSTVAHKDVDVMVMVVGHLWPRMLSDGVVSALLLLWLLCRDWRMGLLMVSVLPVGLFLLCRGLRRGASLEAENRSRLADMVSLFVEYVKGIPLLKAFSESRRLDEDLEEAARRFGENSGEFARSKAKLLALYGFLVDLAFGTLAVGGIALAFGGTLSLTTYFLYIVVSREFYKPFTALENYWMNYLAVSESYRRIRAVLDAPAVREPALPKRPSGADIVFEDVGFSYGKGEFALKGISFRVPAGTTTALVGKSGSGKTTVVNLLLRFWDVQSGRIEIGGVDIRDLRYDDLLGSVSVVMQNVQLFADTIAGNIRIGKPSAGDEEVASAAKRARIHDFIMSLPQGYQTPVSENGTTLSGGQRQRLSIARAFLKGAPILVLDEFTSSVDPANEFLIQEALAELAKERTVLTVAHRLHTIRAAAQILVFHDGAIIERGTHEQLLAQEGYYRDVVLPHVGALC